MGKASPETGTERQPPDMKITSPEGISVLDKAGRLIEETASHSCLVGDRDLNGPRKSLWTTAAITLCVGEAASFRDLQLEGFSR